ncbi:MULTISPECIES: GGDEF domain-containing protein [Stenotrophomonas]|jgi:diguanylate cyclase (GGDEF)-like protein|uniref:GGDEF domain-containing protein n=1 Tax=Stenotrophomonas TaxID=40323 RepID=UPI00129D15D6|nr:MULTISPECIES: GGDEF domain-containing protein [Stenotrophomonas]ELF4102630.1 GGDEF domain-containing protein [Stenotrophomonas maltophilia]MBA0429909.1 GGDEF domain-containing protein [Stenotrophomonas maltophilia]MDH0277630.1 GGDEF domain-containing protein [Stenotrophomonas sp. GD04089]MDH1913654.1 GGDEF domain-containing protein [Stenotrophomonas sp. GD03794]MRI40771.1 GGDEF domain-containing protein [Stenotrophomonas sp. MH181796]
MPVVLALLYVLCHGLVLTLWPGPAGVGSFVFLTGAPLLAAGACLWRARRDRAALGWRATALALLLWAGGMASNMVDALGAGRADITPQASLFLYVLYGVPLVFILARARRERMSISLIDAAMAALLGVLFFVHTQSFADRVEIDPLALVSMQRMFDIQNLCIAGFAVVRWLAVDVPERRSFFRALALYALAYLLVAYYINHYTSEDSFGAYNDLLIDLPFLLLALLALSHTPLPAALPHPRLARTVQAAGPMILPLLLLVVGTLVVDHARPLAVSGFVVATLGFGVRSILLQVDLMERQASLDQLARQDGLTGVANRREFDALLLAEWNRARRSGTELALLLVDIDHFKAFNDQHGHPAGDRCLQAVAAVLKVIAGRGGDSVARYGGEEFAVIVPASPLSGVLALAERLREAVEGLPLPEGRVSISIGVGYLHPPALASAGQLLADADAGLYAAKRAGRNRVVLHAQVLDDEDSAHGTIDC